MKEYIYVFDFSETRILRITLDDKDFDSNGEYIDIHDILKRRGLKESQCNYLFSEKVLEIEEAELI